MSGGKKKDEVKIQQGRSIVMALVKVTWLEDWKGKKRRPLFSSK